MSSLSCYPKKRIKFNGHFLNEEEATGHCLVKYHHLHCLVKIQQALKLCEKKNKLVDRYGADWSWRNSTYYSQMCGGLDRKTLDNEMGLSPFKTDRAVDFL